MDTKEFTEKLRESLERFEEWKLSRRHMTHGKTGIYFCRSDFNEKVVRFFSPNNVCLVSLPTKEVKRYEDEYHQRRREREDEERQERRKNFLSSFSGFE